MTSLLRSAQPLPDHLATVEAWRRRLASEPRRDVLADAYEYGLWRIDSDGCFTYTDHPLNEQSVENWAHSSTEDYAEAIVTILRRRGLDIYTYLLDEARAAGVPEKAIIGAGICLRYIADQH
jgi:hypothetical protein